MRKNNLLSFLIILSLVGFSFTSLLQFSLASCLGKQIVSTERKIGFDPAQKLNSTVKLKIEFIGFEQSLIDLTGLEEKLYRYLYHPIIPPLENAKFIFEFNFATEGEKQQIEDYIQSIAINGTGTGYRLDIDLLKQDLQTGNRSAIFIPRDGMSIDAERVEDYLYQHFYTEPENEMSYTFFIANFSNFDKGHGTWEHWYDVTGIDMDSEAAISWWYSGYRNLSKRAAMGWGGNYRFCYLDLSARSWYFDYVKTAWGTAFGIEGNELYYQYPDLDNLTQTFDPYTTEGKEKIEQYLVEWINSYIGNVFSKPVSSRVCLSQTVSLQVQVFENLTENGYTLDEIQWCINQSKIYQQLTTDLPWIDFEVKIDWVKLSECPDLFNYLQGHVEEDLQGKYIEVWPDVYNYLEDNLETYFDMNASAFVLPCYFFITNEVGFRYTGISFAGLGGMGWEILLSTPLSLFENGNTSMPRRGMSQVMIHELGHSMGLPHPHGKTFGWASSFVADVMSYFAPATGFSRFYEDAIGCAQTEAIYNYGRASFQSALVLYSEKGEPQELQPLIDEIINYFNTIRSAYTSMDYNASATTAFSLQILLQQFIDALQNEENTDSLSSTANSFLGFALFLILPMNYLLKFKRKKTAQ